MMHRIDRFLRLSGAQWALLHAVESGERNALGSGPDLEFLAKHGLIERQNSQWKLTENGRLLAALRREV